MIRIFEDLDSLSRAAAEIFIRKAGQAIQSQGIFNVALSGGNTPHRLYELLAGDPYRDRVAWQAIHVFWGDERCVPLDDPRSNFRMASEALLAHVPIPKGNVHPIDGSLPPGQAAASYELVLQDHLGSHFPILDLILLGMGENAHTASLFPHTPVLEEKVRWVSDVFVEEQGMHRVTFTARLINRARQIVFMVSGAGKAQALQNTLEGPFDPEEYPAQLIKNGLDSPIWLVDKAAARLLTISVECINPK